MKWIFKTSLLLTALISPFSIAANYVPLQSKNTINLSKFTLLGAADPKQTIDIIVWLNLRNQKQFDQVLRDIYTPGHKMYHHYLKKSELESTYFLTSENIKSIKKYLASQHLEVKPTNSHFFIRVKGSVAQVEKAFQVKINRYRYLNKTFYANTQAPSIPQNLAPYIYQISGLHNVRSPNEGSPSKCITPATTPTQSTTSTTYGLSTSINTPLVDNSGNVISPQMTFTGFIPGGPAGHGYQPDQIRQAYGVDTLINSGIDGTNQTVRIVDSCISNTLSTDYAAFQTHNWPSLTPTIYTLSPATVGATNYCQNGTNPTQDNIAVAELTLDLEAVKTMAPNANIIIEWDDNWMTDGASAASVALTQAIDDAMSDNPSWNLITVSHSDPESTHLFPNIDPYLQTAASNAITINVSSGDCGDNIGFSGSLQVNYPSSTPWVTAVGATGLFLDTNNNYSFETAWGTGLNTSYTCYTVSGGNSCAAYTANYTPQGPFPQGFIEGTTGGLSGTYQAPLWQQNTISSLYAGGYSGTIGSHLCSGVMCRAVPDISIFGEAHYPGFETWMSSASCTTSPCQISEGGTSLATPFFTGILALVNQTRQNLGKSTGIGLAAQYLYSLPSGTLHAITNPHGKGNPVGGIPNPNAFQLYQINADLTNNIPDLIGVVYNSDSSLTLGSTWSDITGVGTPIANSFVQAMANQP